MLAPRQLWFLQRNTRAFQIIIPLAASCIMGCTSVLPWLNDPFGESSSPWRLPIDIGWQFHTYILNYGLLCLFCAIFAFLVACANWRSFAGSRYFVHSYVTAGLLCLLPVALFLFQYLCIDYQSMAQLGQQKIQVLLYRQHFGYTTPSDRIAVRPFTLDVSTLGGRVILLIDQVAPGFLFPCLSSWMLIDFKRFFKIAPQTASSSKKSRNRILVFCLGVLSLVILGRAPAAIVCEYEARTLLSAGNYLNALEWLDVADNLNPYFSETAFYHIERGQALYFLYPSQRGDEVRAYLASTYLQQNDYLDAYQELLAVWQPNHKTAWVVDQMSLTLERLAEYTHPLLGAPIKRPDNDDTALPWVHLLTEVDPSNVYGQYVVGRIEYDLHNYRACIVQMSVALQLSHAADLQSSAYTYIALSAAGEGEYAEERILLLKAVELDPNYYNNTAREELSGLR